MCTVYFHFAYQAVFEGLFISFFFSCTPPHFRTNKRAMTISTCSVCTFIKSKLQTSGNIFDSNLLNRGFFPLKINQVFPFIIFLLAKIIYTAKTNLFYQHLISQDLFTLLLLKLSFLAFFTWLTYLNNLLASILPKRCNIIWQWWNRIPFAMLLKVFSNLLNF